MEYEPLDLLASYLVTKVLEETPASIFIVKAAMLVATSGTIVHCRSAEICVMDSKTRNYHSLQSHKKRPEITESPGIFRENSSTGKSPFPSINFILFHPPVALLLDATYLEQWKRR